MKYDQRPHVVDRRKERRKRLLTRDVLTFDEEIAQTRAGYPYLAMMAALNINSKVPL